jgi:hypothetical protein
MPNLLTELKCICYIHFPSVHIGPYATIPKLFLQDMLYSNQWGKAKKSQKADL